MLARGVLCRLAADTPKASTHDLPQLARHLHRTVLARNGIPFPSACVLSRLCGAVLVENRRSYATASSTKPTATVKKAVKKKAAKKAAPKKKAAAKNPKKKKIVAKKVAPKKSAKKALTPEKKESLAIREAKKKALRAPVTLRQLSAWNSFAAEYLKNVKSSGSPSTSALKDANAKFKDLTAAEREHYNHLANEQTAANRAEYQAWVLNYTPEQIRAANQARAFLRRKFTKLAKRSPSNTLKIRDDRQLKKPAHAFMLFNAERVNSGDFKGIGVAERGKLIASEWKSLSESEKKPYQDRFQTQKAEYEQEFEKTYGRK